MLKGGYQIVDLKNIELSDQGFLFIGLYNQLLNNHDKVVMLSNINIEGITFKDYFVQPIVTDEGIECTIGDKTLTVSSDDITIVEDGIIGGGGGGGEETIDTYTMSMITSLLSFNGLYQNLQNIYNQQGAGSFYQIQVNDPDKMIIDDRFDTKFPAPEQSGYTATYYTNFWFKIFASNGTTMLLSFTLPVIITRTKTRTRLNAGAAMDINSGASNPLQKIISIVGFPSFFYDAQSNSTTMTFQLTNLMHFSDLYPMQKASGASIELGGDGTTAPSIPTTPGQSARYTESVFQNMYMDGGNFEGSRPFQLMMYNLANHDECVINGIVNFWVQQHDSETPGDYTVEKTFNFPGVLCYMRGHIYTLAGFIRSVDTYQNYGYMSTANTCDFSITCIS